MNSDQQFLLECATTELISHLMKVELLDTSEAMKIVYSSQLYRKMENTDTGLYREGPLYLYDMLCEERNKG